MNRQVWVCLFVLVSLTTYTECGSGNEWGYQPGIGPSTWHNHYPHCGGSSQSPISVNTAKAVLNTNLTTFNFTGYDSINNVRMSMKNNGHSVQIDLMGQLMTTSGGGLKNTYRAKQFHFHWGSEDKRGSEHDINNHHFPMEMHVVHFDSTYSTFDEAVNATDGVHVLAFLFDVGAVNHHFDEIIQHFYRIAHKDDHVNLTTFPLAELFPEDLKVYYRYHGSLTTPPCSETVIWTIFKETIKISEDQLMKFRHNVHRNYANESDRDISNDFRPPQPLNHRHVYASDPSAIFQPPSSAAQSLLLNICMLNIMLMFYVLCY
ncbi:carbonic anhydrase 7-like isoform X2 [Ostrea edulis]|uniref:carbonic anhydrase 7-like isoform X2 n=1 Tax=Ostrea edulis TaxID=37623 RepID=UPI0024AF0758|nr:carbonic anhydrase 7-like isoform X2 [Ostrea edulis]XP_056006614.1 carbonic anhydrase 7-like isoform X2 [Ostrea edulis]